MKPNSKRRKGKVYLVGSGPGDPGLLTVRGKELIEAADVVVYDYLCPQELLSLAPKAVKIYVGKRGGEPSITQDQINRLLYRWAAKAKRIVRLKGGDPYIFGRGADEVSFLSAKGIPFEVVPGVTAGIAAGAYAGIPLTDRRFASQVTFVTGQEDFKKRSSSISWKSLAQQKGTLVFYMGTKRLGNIVRRLVDQGMWRGRPVAVIQWATRPTQRVVTGTLGTIRQRVEAAGISSPTVMIVGEVVKKRSQLDWFSKRPLFGKRILVTRAREQASELSKRLVELGAEVVEFPTIKVLPPGDFHDVDRAIRNLSQYEWVVFTSANGVSRFLQRVYGLGKDARIFSRAKLCAIGPATSQKLREYGLRADLVPNKFSTEGLMASLKTAATLRGRRILLARADIANQELRWELEKAGAQVHDLEIYRTRPVTPNGHLLKHWIKDGKIDLITFTSSSTAKNLFRAVGSRYFPLVKGFPRIISIGPVTSKTIESLGFQVSREARRYTIPGLVEAVLESVQ